MCMTTIDQSAVLTGKAVVPEKEFSFDQQQRFWGWVFISPWIIGFFAFTFIPIITSLIFTFTHFDLTHPKNTNFLDFDICRRSTPEHTCTYSLDNYYRLFDDPMVNHSLGV